MGSSSRAGARTDQTYRAAGLEDFAGWIEDLLRSRDYDIDSPRGGGRSKLADDAGVHRAAVSRLLQRQSMPDLETMRRIAAVLGVPLREMLIRSGRLTEDDLPLTGGGRPADGTGNATGNGTGNATRAGVGNGGAVGSGDGEVRLPLSPEEAACRMGVPPELHGLFAKVARQFLPEGG
ncbi:helix-turn-helix transcriptional regulator [Streptomyces sp. NBC_00878]|uniref:helix-turn-helix domain-containing protein n=1 Tax=Streptomyces sp. NBC_00878 TaxID=2975854 RepID=UPI002252D282|nr:helix-turn-helix transcriptional regulator [Streptomyces sp. NBC_00878]MCX4907530.1 helix-turn-helix domain-containing protein [Streptomyces sp. NBC_00878]